MAATEKIKDLIKDNQIMLFMKGDRTQPQCGFSAMVIQILDHLDVDYQTYNVMESDEIRQGIKDFSNWPTIPQLYVRGEFIGGCDIVREMFEAGELNQILIQ